MATSKTYDTPDRTLRFQVVDADDGCIMLGFEGFLWHTHPDLLPETYQTPGREGIDRFVKDLLQNRIVIAVYRRNQTISDVRIAFHPEVHLRFKWEDEDIELRYWDGSPYSVDSSNHSS